MWISLLAKPLRLCGAIGLFPRLLWSAGSLVQVGVLRSSLGMVCPGLVGCFVAGFHVQGCSGLWWMMWDDVPLLVVAVMMGKKHSGESLSLWGRRWR